MPNTVRLHRVLAMKREKVYRAFTRARRDGPDMATGALPGCSTAVASWPLWVDSAIERPLSATSLRGGSWPRLCKNAEVA